MIGSVIRDPIQKASLIIPYEIIEETIQELISD